MSLGESLAAVADITLTQFSDDSQAVLAAMIK
jgi:hypothetical protein